MNFSKFIWCIAIRIILSTRQECTPLYNYIESVKTCVELPFNEMYFWLFDLISSVLLPKQTQQFYSSYWTVHFALERIPNLMIMALFIQKLEPLEANNVLIFVTVFRLRPNIMSYFRIIKIHDTFVVNRSAISKIFSETPVQKRARTP